MRNSLSVYPGSDSDTDPVALGPTEDLDRALEAPESQKERS